VIGEVMAKMFSWARRQKPTAIILEPNHTVTETIMDEKTKPASEKVDQIAADEKSKAQVKLKYSQDQLTAVSSALADVEKQLAPLQERLEKLKKDAAYYQSRVSKYSKILGA